MFQHVHMFRVFLNMRNNHSGLPAYQPVCAQARVYPQHAMPISLAPSNPQLPHCTPRNVHALRLWHQMIFTPICFYTRNFCTRPVSAIFYTICVSKISHKKACIHQPSATNLYITNLHLHQLVFTSTSIYTYQILHHKQNPTPNSQAYWAYLPNLLWPACRRQLWSLWSLWSLEGNLKPDVQSVILQIRWGVELEKHGQYFGSCKNCTAKAPRSISEITHTQRFQRTKKQCIPGVVSCVVSSGPVITKQNLCQD